MRSAAFIAALLALAAVSVSSQELDYVKKGYKPPALSGATTCAKAFAGNVPATCPVSAGVPKTDEGKDGSTVCVAGVDGKNYEAVFSLMYPAKNAIPGCTSNEQCGSTPGVICATNGPSNVGVPNTCFPLAPSGCPFPAADAVNKTAVPSTGRKLLGF